MNTKFEEKRKYKYLHFNEKNYLIDSGTIEGLTINQYGEFWHSFVFNENTYDIQGQRLGNMIIFPLNDLTRLVVYLNDVPEEYREYKFEVGKTYIDYEGDGSFTCIQVFDYRDSKFACFLNEEKVSDFRIAEITKDNRVETCKLDYGEYYFILRADEEL